MSVWRLWSKKIGGVSNMAGIRGKGVNQRVHAQ
jgi:hypothetical protein